MPEIKGFTHNAFCNRSDLLEAANALLEPVLRHRSPACARIKFKPSTAAHFDDVAASLEGFARPLWAVTGLLQHEHGGDPSSRVDTNIWLRGLRAGVDPQHEEYWGDVNDFDQRMVEMESIAFALLMTPQSFLSCLDAKAKINLISWLSQINQHDMPQNNWRWFRVFVNLALVKVLGVPRSEVQETIHKDLALLDSFYVDDGWSTDGPWGAEAKQADYYSGSFAIQFAQLLYVHLAPEDEERTTRYRQQAKEFSSAYWRYFDVNGSAIPFGRSLTYRFATGAFWAAAALAGVKLAAPVSSVGSIKGFLMRHLRWWSTREDMFNSDGTLSIGYGYPNLFMSEEYNSPQSVYWCLKSFIVLSLPEDHPFWSCDELPHPLSPSAQGSSPDLIQTIWIPRHIISSGPDHHFLLSAGQMTTKPHRGREAKYGKFAYSSAFGFNVPTGNILPHIAPDSTLCATLDGGDAWVVRARPFNERLLQAHVEFSQTGTTIKIPYITSTWKPWSKLDLEVESALMPLGSHFPGWHVRVHNIRWASDLPQTPLLQDLQIVEGGFSIHSLTAKGLPLPELQSGDVAKAEGFFSEKDFCFLKSAVGVAGMANVTSPLLQSGSAQAGHVEISVQGECSVLKPGPNSNILYQKSSMPTIQWQVSLTPSHTRSNTSACDVWIASAIFAMSASSPKWAEEVEKSWNHRPKVAWRMLKGQKIFVITESLQHWSF